MIKWMPVRVGSKKFRRTMIWEKHSRSDEQWDYVKRFIQRPDFRAFVGCEGAMNPFGKVDPFEDKYGRRLLKPRKPYCGRVILLWFDATETIRGLVMSWKCRKVRVI